VTIDLPRVMANASGVSGRIAGFESVILDNKLSISGNTMLCTFSTAALEFLLQFERQATEPLVAHLTLKGSKIWSRGEPIMYLDGAAFGVEEQGKFLLRFPTGGGTRCSDFEMWFWVGQLSAPVAG
jgi:hypothetical protein